MKGNDQSKRPLMAVTTEDDENIPKLALGRATSFVFCVLMDGFT
jgi:hypothetical protein